jgi:hypothetical protein
MEEGADENEASEMRKHQSAFRFRNVSAKEDLCACSFFWLKV